ncbi:MAG: PaaI family thioesterase [Sideroxydans sp.]|nr:PaaI family thioesterase [Sideroxydans sp.]
MTSLMQFGQAVLAAQPFSVLLSAQMRSFTSEQVELMIPITEALLQQNNFVHGGVLSYAADNALTFAGSSALGEAVVTSEFKINYIRPAIGEFILARASVIHAGKTQAVCRCDVYVVKQAEERLCAIAQGTIVRLSQPVASHG